MRLKATVVLKPDIYEFLTPPPPRKLITIRRYESTFICRIILSFLSDGCKTTESGSFLNTFSKILLIWKSCEYNKKRIMFIFKLQNQCCPPLNVTVFKKRSRMQVAAGLRLYKTRGRKTI